MHSKRSYDAGDSTVMLVDTHLVDSETRDLIGRGKGRWAVAIESSGEAIEIEWYEDFTSADKRYTSRVKELGGGANRWSV